jgi:hypothetical protein
MPHARSCSTRTRSTIREVSGLRRWLRSSAMLAVVFFATMFTVALAHAQYRTSVQGVVTDPTGAAIPGATLTLKNNSTNETVVRTSDNTGVFNFNALPADTFTLTVDHAGFQEKVLDNLTFIPEQANSVNVELGLAGATQQVTVDASQTPALDTETASINATVNSNQIDHLPSAGRDVFQLVQLAPGAVSDGSQAGGGGTNNLPGTQSGGGGSGAGDGIFKTENGPPANANGGQFETNGISIDGISTVSAVWGGSSVITPNEDSVSNVKIVTNDYDAENGRFSGAQIEVTSKSGSNTIHGSAFFRINRPGLNAYQSYNGPGSLVAGTAADRGLERDTQRFNQFGGSVGGPIWKNKFFAFFAYEGIRNNSNAIADGWYDTAAFDALAPAGSIASTFLTFPGAGVSNPTLITETCATAGLIEGQNCRTIAGAGLNIGSPLTTPLGTQDPTFTPGNTQLPGVGGGLSNVADVAYYQTSSPSKVTQAQYNGRLDADATKKDHLSFAIYWVPVNTVNYNGGARAYNLFYHNAINDAFSGIWNHTFSPNFLNEARANAAGWRWNEVADNPQAPVGLPDSTISQIGNFNLNQFGAGLGSDLNQWTYGYKDVATKIVQQHTIKFGGDFTRLYYLQNPTYNDRPNFGFFNIWDFLNDAPSGESGSFNPTTGFPVTSRQDDRENLYGAFVQDAWKVKPNITLNFGVRYSYFGSLYDKQNNFGVVQFGSGTSEFTGLNVRQGGNLWTPQKGNFGPQVSIAWSPSGLHDKLVVRGGYGLNYNQEEIAISAGVSNNPPNTDYYNFTSATPTTINPNIVYGVPSNVHSLFGYPENPNTITTFNTAGLPTAGNANLTAFPSHLPTAYSSHYSLGAEYDLGYQLVASVGYEGSTSHHLIRQNNENAVGAADGLTLNPLVTGLDYYGNGGASSNNALLLELKHQMAHHFSVDAQFTLARSMDDNSGPYSEDMYPYAPRYSWGRSDFDISKLFKIYGLWQPVIFHGQHGWLEKVLGEWTLSGIYNVHSGFGWTPTYYTPELYCQGCGYGSLRPYYTGGAKHSTSNSAFEAAPNTPNSNFPAIGAPTNPDDGTAFANGYFSVPNYAAALAGDTFPGVAPGLPPAPGIDRNSFTGPGYKDLDASVTKGFGIPKMRVLGDDAKLEIRADIFNLFNNSNLSTGSIDSNITSPTFGQAQQALGSRTINFQARFSF